MDAQDDNLARQASIPGPDPGACPNCGQWLKAGMLHDCQRQTRALSLNAWREQRKAEHECWCVTCWAAYLRDHLHARRMAS